MSDEFIYWFLEINFHDLKRIGQMQLRSFDMSLVLTYMWKTDHDSELCFLNRLWKILIIFKGPF